LVAAGVAAGTIGSGAGMWKIGHDRAVLDDYERRLKRHDKNLTDTENRLRSEREGMEASKSRSQVQKDFKGNTDALPPTMRPGGDKRKQYREERLGKVMGVGHIKDRGRRKAVRGKWKNGKFIPQKSILQYILPDKRIPKVLSGLHR